MGFEHFKQIKHYLHISDPFFKKKMNKPAIKKDEKHWKQEELERVWWYKVELIAAEFRQACVHHYIPETNISIDEFMICCFGRFNNIYKMLNKPIKQGYKLYGLMEHRYL